jgi:hypothetical protein
MVFITSRTKYERSGRKIWLGNRAVKGVKSGNAKPILGTCWLSSVERVVLVSLQQVLGIFFLPHAQLFFLAFIAEKDENLPPQ